jgi:RteC protein
LTNNKYVFLTLFFNYFMVVNHLNRNRFLTFEILIMLVFTQKSQAELISKLEDLDRNYSPQNLEDHRLDLIITAIEKIKMKLKSHVFASEKDEIHYFKSKLPETLSLHIYYTHVMEWDRMLKQGSEKARFDFYDSIFTMAENFRNEQKEFYEYCRDGKSDLDRFYFLRSSPMNRERIYQPGFITDPASPPIYCGILAKFLAYFRLEHELHLSISDNSQIKTSANVHDQKLTWTLSKISLVEIIYALKEVNAFNHGKADLKTITEYFERIFNIQIGNVSRSFQEIMSRKMGYTVFIDLLKEWLLKKIDAIEGGNMN